LGEDCLTRRAADDGGPTGGLPRGPVLGLVVLKKTACVLRGVRAAQQATKTIPILAVADDLVGSGLATSLAHQGGNTTGVSILASELDVKRLEILHEFVPRAQRIAVVADPSTVSTRAQLVRAARDLGLELVWFEAQSPDEIVRAFDAMASAKIEAINLLASPLLNQQRQIIIERAVQLRFPAIYQRPETAEEGGFLAYGPRFQQIYRLIVARLLVKLLQGTKPADLPIEQPTKFELVLNLKTAKALGITLSADEIAGYETIDPCRCRKTSVSLEDEFWTALKEIATTQNVGIPKLISMIDSQRRNNNLSSAIRVYVLNYFKHGTKRSGRR
jgi:hypothetical protein